MERAQKHCIATITKTSTKTNYQTLMVWPVKIEHLCFFKLSVSPSSGLLAQLISKSPFSD